MSYAGSAREATPEVVERPGRNCDPEDAHHIAGQRRQVTEAVRASRVDSVINGLPDFATLKISRPDK
jgi:hypothetical protein